MGTWIWILVFLQNETLVFKILCVIVLQLQCCSPTCTHTINVDLKHPPWSNPPVFSIKSSSAFLSWTYSSQPLSTFTWQQTHPASPLIGPDAKQLWQQASVTTTDLLPCGECWCQTSQLSTNLVHWGHRCRCGEWPVTASGPETQPPQESLTRH